MSSRLPLRRSPAVAAPRCSYDVVNWRLVVLRSTPAGPYSGTQRRTRSKSSRRKSCGWSMVVASLFRSNVKKKVKNELIQKKPLAGGQRTASGDEVLVVLEGDERDRALAEVMLQGATDIVWRAGLLEVYLFSWVRVGGQKRSVREGRRQTMDARPRRGKWYLARGSCSRSASPRWRHPRCERPPPAQRSLLPIVRFWFVGKVVGVG